ncbi:leucine-rich repeat domain-containing protein [Diaphorobacter caeni]|uniref:transcriptional regulator n=1 Tax=Diaphorobacter caeni TaxID=2784387 RepID=UPI001E349121|nr:transcriptional regulator [Diaphorobacter caeni]
MSIVINGQECADGRFPIHLTPGQTHTLVTSPGMGSLQIGPETLDRKADLFLPADAKVNWNCFDPFETGARSPWPRFIYYTGNDTGFFDWSRQRRIEDLRWRPLLAADTDVHVQGAQISSLTLWMSSECQGGLHLHLADDCNISSLSLCGHLGQITVTGRLPSKLFLGPQTRKRMQDKPLQIPPMQALESCTTQLEISNTAASQAISLDCLARFPQLESLNLHGRYADLSPLAQLTRLTSLGLSFMPELPGLPDVPTWPDLNSLIAYNVEESTGKRLRAQIKSREKLRPWTGHASVTQLRKPEWWAKEYGRPFAGWPTVSAKKANAAYDRALEQLNAART